MMCRICEAFGTQTREHVSGDVGSPIGRRSAMLGRGAKPADATSSGPLYLAVDMPWLSPSVVAMIRSCCDGGTPGGSIHGRHLSAGALYSSNSAPLSPETRVLEKCRRRAKLKKASPELPGFELRLGSRIIWSLGKVFSEGGEATF